MFDISHLTCKKHKLLDKSNKQIEDCFWLWTLFVVRTSMWLTCRTGVMFCVFRWTKAKEEWARSASRARGEEREKVIDGKHFNFENRAFSSYNRAFFKHNSGTEWTVIAAFSNSSGVVWTENIWCVLCDWNLRLQIRFYGPQCISHDHWQYRINTSNFTL